MVVISPAVRRLSGKAVGARGSGKTLFAAHQLYLDYVKGVGGICIDPMGKISEYLLQMIAYSGDPGLWKRLIYIPVGGMVIGDDETVPIEERTWVVPTPFLYNRSGHDSLQDQTARPIGMWKRLSPQQENAPIQGMPSIERTANYAGMLLAAAGNQLVPDAASLLRSPELWVPLIRTVSAQYPELAQPARYFTEAYPKLRPADKLSQTLSFSNKIDPYVLNPRLAAQYGGNSWGVDLPLAEQGYVLLFDCQYLPDEEHRTGLTWIFSRCMELFRARGPRRDVVNFVLDELSWLVDSDNPLIEKDLRSLIAVLGRNYGISSFFTYQEVTQPPWGLRLVMDMVGYSLYAGSSDPDAAKRLSQLLDDFDPEWIRREDPIYIGDAWVERTTGNPAPIDYRPVPFNPQEQELLNAAKHRKRPGLTFALSMAPHEGAAARYRGTVSIRDIVDRHHFDQDIVEEAKRRLVKQRGRTVSDVLTEISTRQPHTATRQVIRQQPVKTGKGPLAVETPQLVFADAPPPRIG